MAVEWDDPKTIISNAWAEAAKECSISLGDHSLDDRFSGDSLISLLHQVQEGIARSTRNPRKVKLLEKFASFARRLDRYGRCIDTFVQASPEASIIWGSIRVILQFVVTRVNSLSKIVNVFTCILENFGRYELYQSLFAHDRNVQCVLALIYADVIIFCARTASFYNAKGLKASVKRATVNFESRYGNAIDNFNRHRLLVEDTVRAAGHQRDHTAAKKMESDNKRQRIRKWLSPLTRDATYYESDHRAACMLRTPGTCGWLRKSKKFQQWLASIQPTLLLTGPPGHGKTIMMSDLIDNISVQVPEGKVVYFYCKYQDTDKRTSLSVIKSLLLQLLDTGALDPQAWQQLVKLNETSIQDSARSDEHLSKLCEVMWRTLHAATQPIFVLIDALNECEDWKVFLEELKTHTVVKAAGSTKFIISCRVDPDVLDVFSNSDALPDFLKIQRQDTADDMALYISTQIEVDRRMRAWPDLLKGLAQSKLLAKADGMFLWAKLMIGQIASQPTLGDVEQALDDLPLDLPQTYLRILNGLRRNPYLQRILQWLCMSNRILKAQELKLILEIDHSDTTYNFKRAILNNLSEVLAASCGPLVELQEDEVRFTHFTVKEFLLSESAASTPFGVEAIEAHKEIVVTCLTYLSFRENPNYHEGIFFGLLNNYATCNPNSMDLGANKVREDENTDKDTRPRLPHLSRMGVSFHDILLTGCIEDRDVVLEALYDTPNTALFDYAVRFLTHHLLWIATNGRPNALVLKKLRELLLGRQCLTFIESTILLMGAAGPMVSKLQLANSLGDLGIEPWISGARILLSEFDDFLRYYPGKIRNIPSEYFSADNIFNDMLLARPYAAIDSAGEISDIANLPDFGEVAILDPSRKHFFTVSERRIECRNLEDGLLLEEFELGIEHGTSQETILSFKVLDVRMSKDRRHLAIYAEYEYQDELNTVWKIHLLALHRTEGQIFSCLPWSRSTEVGKYTFQPQRRQDVSELTLGDLNNISFSADSKFLYGPYNAISLENGAKTAMLFSPSDTISSICFAESAPILAMVVDKSTISVVTTAGEQLSSLSFPTGDLVIKAVSPCGKVIAFFKSAGIYTHRSTNPQLLFIYDWSQGYLTEISFCVSGDDHSFVSPSHKWYYYPMVFNERANRLLRAFPQIWYSRPESSQDGMSNGIQTIIFELLETSLQIEPLQTPKWQRILAHRFVVPRSAKRRPAISISMEKDDLEQILVMTRHEIQSWILHGLAVTGLTVRRSDITPSSGLYGVKNVSPIDIPAMRAASSPSGAIIATIKQNGKTGEKRREADANLGQFDINHINGFAAEVAYSINANHTCLLRIYDLRCGMKLLHDVELDCAGKMSPFAVDNDGSRLVVGSDVVTINASKIHTAKPLADALRTFQPENFAYKVVSNTMPHHTSLRWEDFQFHPKGNFLGFSYQNPSEGLTGLCVFDVRLWRPVWSWSTKVDKFGSTTISRIMYTFHPTLPQVAWGLEGLHVAICDFSTLEAPRVLPGKSRQKWDYPEEIVGGLIKFLVTCDQPFTGSLLSQRRAIDFKLRQLAFSACGQYLIYRDRRVAGVKVFHLRDDSRMGFTDFLPKDDAWSYNCTFSSVTGEDDDDIASLMITTTGLHGEVFVSQRDFVHGRDRRAVLPGLPKSLVPKPGISGTGVIMSQGSNVLEVVVCKNFPVMQPIVLSFTNVPWTAWEGISGKALTDFGDKNIEDYEDAELNLVGKEKHEASKRGRIRLARELRAYRTFVQDPKWLDIARRSTENAESAHQFPHDYTYDDKGLPSFELLCLIAKGSPYQWSDQVGRRFEYLWPWKITIPGSESLWGDWRGYISQSSRERVDGFMSGAEMSSPFFTWDSWSGYRGTINDLEAGEEEE